MSQIIHYPDTTEWFRQKTDQVLTAITSTEVDCCQHIRNNGVSLVYTPLLLDPVRLACANCAIQPGALTGCSAGYMPEYCDRCGTETGTNETGRSDEIRIYFPSWYVPTGHLVKIAVQLCFSCAEIEALPPEWEAPISIPDHLRRIIKEK